MDGWVTTTFQQQTNLHLRLFHTKMVYTTHSILQRKCLGPPFQRISCKLFMREIVTGLVSQTYFVETMLLSWMTLNLVTEFRSKWAQPWTVKMLMSLNIRMLSISELVWTHLLISCSCSLLSFVSGEWPLLIIVRCRQTFACFPQQFHNASHKNLVFLYTAFVVIIVKSGSTIHEYRSP